MTRAHEKKFNRTETPAPFGKTNGSSKHKKRLARQENTAVLSAWRLSILQSTQVFVSDSNFGSPTPWSYLQANLAAVSQIKLRGIRKAMPINKLFAIFFKLAILLFSSLCFWTILIVYIYTVFSFYALLCIL